MHIGVVIVVVGLAGSAFNRNVESEMSVHDQMHIGPYTLVCTGFTQDSNADYDSDYALLNVMQGRQDALPDDAGEARLPPGRRRPAADHGGDSLRAGLGFVCGV